jgi:ankyrin repeat protein
MAGNSSLKLIQRAITRNAVINLGHLHVNSVIKDPEDMTEFAYTLLSWAALKGSLASARALVELGADVNKIELSEHPDEYFTMLSPLHCAILRDHPDMVTYLIEKGALMTPQLLELAVMTDMNTVHKRKL